MSKLPLALIAAALPLALLTVPASAADEPAPAAATPPPAKEKTVCRRVSDTGSILPKRVCLSAGEWAAIDKQHDESDARATGRKLDSSSTMMSGGANIGR